MRKSIKKLLATTLAGVFALTAAVGLTTPKKAEAAQENIAWWYLQENGYWKANTFSPTRAGTTPLESTTITEDGDYTVSITTADWGTIDKDTTILKCGLYFTDANFNKPIQLTSIMVGDNEIAFDDSASELVATTADWIEDQVQEDVKAYNFSLSLTDDSYIPGGTKAVLTFHVGEVAPPTGEEYDIVITDDGNGTASASVDKAAVGSKVTLTATPNEGYGFESWTVVSGDVTVTNDKFTMPESAVEIKANFAKTYSITTSDDGNGTASADVKESIAGKTIKLSTEAKDGYKFKEWKVVSGDVEIADDDTFVMPESDVEVKAVFYELQKWNAVLGYAGGGWWPKADVSEVTEPEVDGDGTYKVICDLPSKSTGLVMLYIDIEGLAGSYGVSTKDVKFPSDATAVDKFTKAQELAMEKGIEVSDVKLIVDGKVYKTLSADEYFFGDVEGKGNLRIEICNEYGAISPTNYDSFVAESQIAIEFTITGLDEAEIVEPEDTEETSEETSEEGSEDASEEGSEDASEEGSEDASEEGSEDASEEVSEDASEDTSDDTTTPETQEQHNNATATGDSAPIAMLFAVMAMAAAGVVVMMKKED